MQKILLLCIISLVCISCSVNTNNINNEKNSTTTVKNIPSKEKTEDNKALLDDMFRFYCNISAIRSLYTIAPESDYYTSLIESNDIQAQKFVTTILLSKRMILGQDELKETLITYKEKYPRTIGLLLESDKKLVENFEGVNKINTVEEFKNNLSSLGESVEIYSNIPSIFEKEYTLSQDDSGAFLLQGELLCNNHTDISFWNDRQVKTQNIISNLSLKETEYANKVIISGNIYSNDINRITVSFSNKYSSFPNDNYTLKEYKKGDSTFKYNAFRKYKVLDYGINEYIIKAYNGDNLIDQKVLQVRLNKGNYNYQYSNNPSYGEIRSVRNDIKSHTSNLIYDDYGYHGEENNDSNLNIGTNINYKSLSNTYNYNYKPNTYINPNHRETIKVSGYYKKDGTYVKPYIRTVPDNRIDNNLRYK